MTGESKAHVARERPAETTMPKRTGLDLLNSLLSSADFRLGDDELTDGFDTPARAVDPS